MRNFWAYVAFAFFGPPIAFALCYALWLLLSVLYGGASCLPTTCQ